MSAAAEVHSGPFVRDLLGRSDYAIISELVEPNSRVLDLGCGDGALLGWLADNKNVDARGIEIDSAKVRAAIARGVSAFQGDIDQGLADYPDQAFDYVILSQTLQETRHPLSVLREMLRVGRHAIVAFPNFGHWRVRLALALGRMPATPALPDTWYGTANIHLCTVADFEDLCRERGWRIPRRALMNHRRSDGGGALRLLPNLLAEVALYLLQK